MDDVEMFVKNIVETQLKKLFLWRIVRTIVVTKF